MILPAHISSGVRFSCIDCGRCCTGDPGVVAMTEAEAETLARLLDKPIHNYLIPHQKGYRLREKPNGDCIFFDQRCTIYEARPSQCRTYPFWLKNVRSAEAWERAKAQCPGIGQGPVMDESHIFAQVQQDMENIERLGIHDGE